MSDWDDLDNQTRHGYWYAIKWAIAILLASLVIAAGLWALGVVSSGVKGQGDAVRQKNSAGNRIAAQEGFQANYNEILAADRRIDVLWAAWQDDRTDPIAKTNYTGAVTYCVGLVGDYNARAEKYTQEAFRDANLPRHIGTDDAATDCKRTQNQETPK
jgi:hypothetical protein